MPAARDNRRRMSQERDLPPGTALVFKRYRARSETWEHEHCRFCFTKFMDPDFSEAHRRFVEKRDHVLAEGYTPTGEHEQRATGAGSALRVEDGLPAARRGGGARSALRALLLLPACDALAYAT